MKHFILLLLLSFVVFSCGRKDDVSFASDRGDTSDATNDPGPGGQNVAGQITAGEWRDLDNWSFWQGLMANPDYEGMPAAWSFDLTDRISAHVSDPDGHPIANVRLALLDAAGVQVWENLSDNDGRAEFWPHMYSGAQTGQMQFRLPNGATLPAVFFSDGVNEIVLENALPQATGAQIAFLVDATGSMGDELSYLKTELLDVIQRVETAHPGQDVQTGAVFYRDVTDDYVTRLSPFSSDAASTLAFIADQSAGGGGDYPEAVEEGLRETVRNLQWSETARLRIAFIILDAPPHDRPEIIAELGTLASEAAAKGIKLVPVLASGGDKDTEFLMRFLSIATNGTYTFITDDSGIGNDHLEPSVGPFQVEYLNDLMVRLINAWMD